jgi:dTDP-4-dehydrorhamnose 3,5-epimerase
MEVIPTALAGLVLVKVAYHGDERGTFAEVFNRERFAAAGLPHAFVQDNQSWSREAGTLRGLHWQRPPFAQSKLVRVLKGAVLDVAVDLRRGSPTHGRHVMVELSVANRLQLLVPKGFAHGFLTLEPDTEVLYKVDAAYAAEAEGGVHWADPDLALPWPKQPAVAVVSPKDQALPNLRELQDPFIA